MKKKLMTIMSLLISSTLLGNQVFAAKLFDTVNKVPNNTVIIGSYKFPGLPKTLQEYLEAASSVEFSGKPITVYRYQAGNEAWKDADNLTGPALDLPEKVVITHEKTGDSIIQASGYIEVSSWENIEIPATVYEDNYKDDILKIGFVEYKLAGEAKTKFEELGLKNGDVFSVVGGSITKLSGSSTEPDKPIEDKDTVDALKEVLGREVKNAEKILKDAQSNGSISTSEQKTAEAEYVDAIKSIAALAGVSTDVSTSSEKKSRIVDVELPSEIKTYGDFAKAVTYLTKATKAFNDAINGTTPEGKVTITFSSNDKNYGIVEAVYENNSLVSGQSIPKGSKVTFTAKVNDNNNGQFDGWTVNKENKGNTNPLTLTVTEATTVVGKFSDKSPTPDVKGPSLTVTGAVYSVTDAVYTGVATSVYGGTATATYASSSSPIATIDITGNYIQNFSLIGVTVNENNNSPFSENTEYNDISSLITVNENSNLGIVPAENKFDAEKVFASKRQLIVKYDVKNNPNKVVYLSIKVEEAKN